MRVAPRSVISSTAVSRMTSAMVEASLATGQVGTRRKLAVRRLQLATLVLGAFFSKCCDREERSQK